MTRDWLLFLWAAMKARLNFRWPVTSDKNYTVAMTMEKFPDLVDLLPR